MRPAPGSDWELAVKYLVESLDKFKVSEKEEGEFLAIAPALKANNVEKP